MDPFPLLKFLVAAACLAAWSLSVPPAAHADGAADRHSSAEDRLKSATDAMRRGELDKALTEAERLVAEHPNFRLAQLVYGDLLLARGGSIGRLADLPNPIPAGLEELRDEALARLRAHSEHPPPQSIPRYLLRLQPEQKHAVVVDASRSRVYLYRNANGTPRLVADYYASLGKRGINKLREGDQKTPVGVYYVTSEIPGKKLPDLYGAGAFPISYPNEWDRMRGRTGYGIWLHGVPAATYARSPWASDGCIALANPELQELGKHLQVGLTPVVIAERVEWLKSADWQAEREAFMRDLERWRSDWESRDPERYLSHYAALFRSDSMSLAAWAAHKRRVNAAKKWIRVSLGNLSAFRAPGEEPLMVVTFDQDYRSDTFTQHSRKRQYWVMEDGRWKIAYEAPVRAPVLAMPESFGNR